MRCVMLTKTNVVGFSYPLVERHSRNKQNITVKQQFELGLPKAAYWHVIAADFFQFHKIQLTC